FADCFKMEREPAGPSGDAAMSQPAKAQEPSMEEILASIRRIIADDDASKSPSGLADAPPPSARAMTIPQSRPAAPPPRSGAPAPPATAVDPALRPGEIDAKLVERNKGSERMMDVLDLTEAMAASAPTRTEGFRTIEGTPDVAFEDHAEERAPAGRGG